MNPRSPSTSRIASALELVGQNVITRLSVSRELASMLRQTVYLVFSGKWRAAQLIEQLFAIGNRSVLFVTVTLGFLGLISIFQVAIQIQKVLPDYSMVGAAFLTVMIREFGPTITGLMVATRTGSAIAAEIGSMVVTEQIDALRMSNADPIGYLVVPRFIACGIMLVVLSVFAVLVATATGMVMGRQGFGIPYNTFLNLSLVKWQDVVIGLMKAGAYGFAIPIIAAQAGLSARGGSEGVGWATTRSVVNCSFAVIVLDFFISGFGYLFLSP